MQPSDRVNINWSPSPVQNNDAAPNKYEATWSNGEKTYTITVGIPKGLSHEYVKNIIEEQFKEFKVNDMDMLAENKFRYDPLKKDRESKTFSDGKTEITLKRTELTGRITGMPSPKDESDLMIEAVVVPSPQKREDGVENRSLSSETSSKFNEALFEHFTDEMVLSMLMKLPVKEIARIRRVNSRFRDIGGEALAKKISDENIPLAKLGLEGNAKVLALLESLCPVNRSFIKMLDLSRTEVDNRFLARLSSLTSNLQNLNLEGCDQITDDGLQHLAPLTQLRSLDFAWCLQITDDGLKHLASLAQLRVLNFADCEITDDGLQHLAPLTQLRSLSLADPRITNDGLQHLAPFKKLENLSLAWCSEITNDGLQYLAPLTELRSLNFALCRQITNYGLQHLAPLTELRCLNLACCTHITNDGLQYLAPFKKLENLSFACCNQIIDNGLQYLAPLTQLRSLNLRSCYNITDRGIQYLFPLTQLQKLSIAHCNKITDAGRNALKKHIPDLKFY